MKKTVLTYGLIAGLIVAAWLQIAIAIGMENMMEYGMFLGYTAMIIAFAFIFVAVKKYREQHNGIVNFKNAFLIGLYITLIASTFYVISWLIDYYVFVPDFMEKYTAHALEKLEAAGATAAEISKANEEMAGYIEAYKNPLMVILFTYLEILPVGLAVSLLAAVLLKRTQKN